MGRPSAGFRHLCSLTAAATYLLIVAGGVVRVTGSGLGCGATNDWPLCAGGILPPLRQDAIIEFTHRWLAATATALVVTLAVVAWTRYRSVSRIVWPAAAVVVLFIVQIILGAVTVKLSLPGTVILIHLANAMLLLGALVYITFTAAVEGTQRGKRLVATRGRATARHMRLASLAAGASYIVVITGALVVARGAGYACAGWPLCGSGVELDGGALSLVNLGHRLAAGTVVVLAALVVMAGRRAAPGDPYLRLAGITAAFLLVAQVVAGALVVELRLPAAARGIHLALASALWVAFLLTALLSRTVNLSPDGPRLQPRAEPTLPRPTPVRP